VIIMKLEDREALVAVALPADDAVLRIHGTGRGNKPTTIELKPVQRETLRHRRTAKGVPLTPKIIPERLEC
jgi:topoisomerase-4 subunit A